MNVKDNIRGTLTALITPFDEKDLKIDYASLDKLIDFQIAASVDGLVVCGSTGEAASLSDDEIYSLIRHVKNRIKGKMPCIGGIITNNTERAIQMAQFMAEEKLDAALVVTPPYIKPTQEGIMLHFEAIKSKSALPLIAYNIPGRAAVSISPQTLAEMIKQNTISGIKDSTASIELMLQTASMLGGGNFTQNGVAYFAGEDSLVHPIMACGGAGVISASANVIPELFVKITQAAAAKRWEDSLSGQIKIMPFIKTMFIETNPIPVKAALKIKGIIKSDYVRVPLSGPRTSTLEQVSSALKDLS